ncbi:hypothetical protein JW824_01405 [bacterium]|nr:hypothetical protein [bacterium]RQV98557.1 MAG: hypothetical protein EH221_01795 [bacterium]
MSIKSRCIHILFWNVVILSLLVFSCASKKPMWGDPQTGLILQYRIAQDQKLNYNVSINQTQEIDLMSLMGQVMETVTDVNLDFTMEGTGIDEQQNLSAQIKMDALDIAVSSMQGKTNINTSVLIGKSFGMSLSPIGRKEFIDIESVPKINFGEMSGEQSVKSYFMELFSELSANPVKIGESWTVQSEFTESTGNLDLLIKLESQNTLDGLETVDGMECARIQTQYTGTISGSGTQGGMYMTLVGDLESTATWYFAFKEGLFVKEIEKQSLDAEIDLGDMGVLPMVQNTTLETKLIP